MLNQVQYHQAFVEGGEQKSQKGGFQGMLCLVMLQQAVFCLKFKPLTVTMTTTFLCTIRSGHSRSMYSVSQKIPPEVF